MAQPMSTELKTTLFFLFVQVIAFFYFGVYTFIKLVILNNHLKKHNYQRWRELTSLSFLGPGISNPFRAFPYFFNKKDTKDEKILRLKDSIKYGWMWILILFLSIFFTTIIMIVTFG